MKNAVQRSVFEVIVRQALKNTAWREACRVAMEANGISEDEVSAEVEGRRNMPHIEPADLCVCKSCHEEKQTISEKFNEKIDSIEHSDRSPCACPKCRSAVNATVNSMYEEVKKSIQD